MKFYTRKLIIALILLISFTVASGCSSKEAANQLQQTSTRNDIFTDDKNVEHNNDKAIVNINFSLKSLASRFFEMYNKHTDPPLAVYFNIDGQTIIFNGDPLFEDKYTVNINNNEKGSGWRYNFNKKIYISPGSHKLTISIPVDNVLFESNVNFHAGINTLTVTPIYKKRSSQRPHRERNFSAGVQTVQIQLD